MAFNQYARRGKAQLTITAPVIAVTGTTTISADVAQGEMLTIATVSLSGTATMQLPCVAADAGQWWWINTANVTLNGQTLNVKGTGTDGNVTGTSPTIAAGKIFACMWDGTNMVRMTADQ